MKEEIKLVIIASFIGLCFGGLIGSAVFGLLGGLIGSGIGIAAGFVIMSGIAKMAAKLPEPGEEESTGTKLV